MNEAYEWLKKWVDEGTWLYGEGAGVWGLHLSQPTHGSMGFIEFRNSMKKLLEVADREEINIKFRNNIKKLIEEAESEGIND